MDVFTWKSADHGGPLDTDGTVFNLGEDMPDGGLFIVAYALRRESLGSEGAGHVDALLHYREVDGTPVVRLLAEIDLAADPCPAATDVFTISKQALADNPDAYFRLVFLRENAEGDGSWNMDLRVR